MKRVRQKTIGKDKIDKTDTVAMWQKVLPKSLNVAKEKLRWQDKLMADILHNFSKSRRKAAEEIFSDNVTFRKFLFKYVEDVKMFWHNITLKTGKTFWPDRLTCALTWQQ
jgi:hypothetical protein